jgi:hypothetical protein
MNTSCASRIPPIQTVATYPRTFTAAPAARLVSGHASLTARRAAWVAAQTAGDAFLTSAQFFGNPVGLWGGSVTLERNGPQLTGYRFVADATATGTFVDHSGNGLVGAITIHYRGVDYPVHVSWSQRSRFARATIAGATLTLPAPGP